MRSRYAAIALTVAAAVGFATPFVVPAAWMANILCGGLLAILLFGGIAGASADEGGTPGSMGGVFLWLAIGTDRPMAEARAGWAVILFFAALAYLACFAAGAFAAVRA